MLKFEQIGVNLQTQSDTIQEAERNFALSCKICCNSGLFIKCDRCHISACHTTVIAAIESIAVAEKANEINKTVPTDKVK